jgi:hypothetical protein
MNIVADTEPFVLVHNAQLSRIASSAKNQNKLMSWSRREPRRTPCGRTAPWRAYAINHVTEIQKWTTGVNTESSEMPSPYHALLAGQAFISICDMQYTSMHSKLFGGYCSKDESYPAGERDWPGSVGTRMIAIKTAPRRPDKTKPHRTTKPHLHVLSTVTGLAP